VICLFAREVYDLETVSRALAVVGIEKTPDELKNTAREILKLKLSIREKMGFKTEEHPFAKRFFETVSPHGMIDPELMKNIVSEYSEKIKAYK